MFPRDDVILSFSKLPEGATETGQVCPQCRGGRSQERSLSVGVSGGRLWWRCHRASCGWTGKHSLSGREDAPATHDERRQRFKSFKRTAIPAKLKQTLAERLSVSEETLDMAGWSYTYDYDGLGDRVIMPIFSPGGHVRGEQFRSYSGHAKKAIINGRLDENQISWYRWKKYGPTLIIVEDIPSAVRLAEAGVHALALCGTVLNLERIIEIRDLKYKNVWLALDNDAFNQAVKYVGAYDKWVKMKVKRLEMDIKDMPTTEFQLFMQEIL